MDPTGIVQNSALWKVAGVGAALLFTVFPCAIPQPVLAQSGVGIKRHDPSARHSMTVRETLLLSTPSSVQISPDGTRIAYVVTQPILERNEDHATLHVIAAGAVGKPKVIAEGTHISALRWSPDSQSISYAVENHNGTEIWRSRFGSHGVATKQLTHSSGEVAHYWEASLLDAYPPYDISPDGSRVVFAAFDSAEADRNEARAVLGGVLYTGEFVKPLSDLELRQLPFSLWLQDAGRPQPRKLWTKPIPTFQAGHLPEFRWSRDGKTIALLYETPETQRYTLALLDARTRAVTQLLTDLGLTQGLRWSDDGASLLFASEGETGTSAAQHRGRATYKFELRDGQLQQMATGSGSVATAPATSSEAAARAALAAEQTTGDSLSACSLNAAQIRAACIRQAPMIPPEVVAFDVTQDRPVTPLRVCTHLNPAYDSIALGNVSRLSWPNRQGGGSAGLILPVEFQPGKRYPLLVMLYNTFSGRRFISDAGGFTSYPAQAFAGRGYVVLLMNVPTYSAYPPGDFAAAREASIDAVVRDIQAAIEILDARGLVDKTKMGIMGWSGGSFWTNYIVTHYPDWFQAAASGEGAIHYPGQYWLGDDVWRQRERNFFGGGPYGQYYERWREISPVLNADRLKIPLLMEYSTIYTAGLEMRTAILEQGGKAELVIYPDETHVLQKPLNRYNSMMRHYDWFNFWLLHEEDPDPSKVEQYARWRELRKLQQQNEKNSPALKN